jgi:uncharacterized protein
MSRLRLIDAPEFARLGRVLEGCVPLVEFERLGDGLRDPGGSLRYRIGGEVDKRGYPALVLDLQARLLVTCQRCLQELELPVKLHNRIRLVESPQDLPLEQPDETLAGDEDVVAAAGPLDVLAMIEDEMLLALPLAPRHEECEVAGSGTGMRIESPFGVLARLKKDADR